MRIIENDKYRIVIEQDENPENPRAMYEHASKMICFHKRFRLGDSHDYDHEQYNNWDELESAICRKENAVAVLPLYLLDHSCLEMSITDFKNCWDSGRVGLILISGKDAREQYGVKRISKKLKCKILADLESDVIEYNQYLTGEAYSITLIDNETDEDIDSFYGFYGEDFWKNGMTDSLSAELVISLYPELKKEYGENKFIEGKIKELVIQ